MTATASALETEVAGLHFKNPIILAAGTAGFGREVDDVINLDTLGGLATKAVSNTPRHGAKPLRVSEFAGGMINAIGLANPGLAAVKSEALPWLAARQSGARVLVNVVGNSIDDFTEVVEGLTDTPGVDAFELNVSCPNVKSGGMEFGADPVALDLLVRAVRDKTPRPLFVKLSPTLGAGIVDAARIAVTAGASGLTLINTMPGLVIDSQHRRPKIGFGTGGVSGPALLPLGILATWRVSQALPGVPIIGLGGVSTADDALQYIMAGATLVGIGTAALRNPRTPERIVKDLTRLVEARGLTSLRSLVGTLVWPT